MQIFSARVTRRDPNLSAEIINGIPYRKGFEMFGEKFVCHKNLKHENLKTVSHFSTGIAIAHENTYKDAIAEAKRLLSLYCGEKQDFIHLLEDYAGDHNLNPIYIN